MDKNKRYLMETLKQSMEITFDVRKSEKLFPIKALLTKISNKGFEISVKRKNLPIKWQSFISLDFLLNQNVSCYFCFIDFSLDAVLSKVEREKDKTLSMYITFQENVPRYWKECLFDMIKSYPEGEFSQLCFR